MVIVSGFFPFVRNIYRCERTSHAAAAAAAGVTVKTLKWTSFMWCELFVVVVIQKIK